MFRSLRWRLTFWFVVLTSFVYILSTAFAFGVFRQALNAVIEDEVRSAISEIMPSVRVHDGRPTLREWARTSLNLPFKFLPTIQLYDTNDVLIERYGPHGVQKLYREPGDYIAGNHSVRVFSTPLLMQGKTFGFLQIQINLRNRDRAVNTFVNAIKGVAPFLLVSLAVVGYVFSTLAARPIELSFEVLRRFMSDAGHELGTPISIIQANAELLEPELADEAATQRLDVIVRSTDRLGSLVQDLILLSKMESPQVQQKKQPIELDQIVRSVLEEFDALFAGKGITLTSEKIQPAPMLGDQDWLKRMLMNLLQNAMRYTDKGGQVTVNLETSGRGLARLTVSDTGVGIPEESVPHIFDRFYRVDKSRSRAAGGVGLGLSIVKAIVDAHKGKIEVTSKLEKGTTFAITLPLRI